MEGGEGVLSKHSDIKRFGPNTGAHKSKPLELHAAEGRPVAEPVMLSARFDPLELPLPPADMPEEGKQLWQEVLPWLVQVNVIQTIDLPIFHQMCRVYATVLRNQKVLDEQGYFALGSGGQITDHPAVKVLQTAQMMFLRFAAEFGMTTMARTRLGLMDTQRRSIQQDMDWTLGPSTRNLEEAS